VLERGRDGAEMLKSLRCKLGLHKYDAIPTVETCLHPEQGIFYEVVCIRCGHRDDFNVTHRTYELLKNRGAAGR
jgi:hypothetical protein